MGGAGAGKESGEQPVDMAGNEADAGMSSASPFPDDNRITTEQMVKISKRIPDKKADEAFQKLIKEKYGVGSINQLSFDAANELIENKKWWE